MGPKSHVYPSPPTHSPRSHYSPFFPSRSSCFTFIVNLYHCTSNPSTNTLPLAHSPYHIWTHDLTPPMPLYSPGVHFFVKLNTTCDKINKSIFYIKRHRNGSNFYQSHCQIPLPTILLYKWFIYPTIWTWQCQYSMMQYIMAPLILAKLLGYPNILQVGL